LANNPRKPSYILLTVDVEDWFQVENFKQSIPFDSWPSLELRVERNVHRLIDLFDSVESAGPKLKAHSSQQNGSSRPKATFFVLGWLAERLPHLVREIHSRGHEIASHGLLHNLPEQNPLDEYASELADSRKLLEDTIGENVSGYRTPSFAIHNDLLKMIEDAGYLYDSSYNSFEGHGRYGRLDPTWDVTKGIACRISESFHELPISNIKIGKQIIPWGGGGYFRLLPFRIFHLGISYILKRGGAYLFYMHPWEIDPEQPRVKTAPISYKFRHYVNLSSTYEKLKKLLMHFSHCRFITCTEYLRTVMSEQAIEQKRSGFDENI